MIPFEKVFECECLEGCKDKLKVYFEVGYIILSIVTSTSNYEHLVLLKRESVEKLAENLQKWLEETKQYEDD